MRRASVETLTRRKVLAMFGTALAASVVPVRALAGRRGEPGPAVPGVDREVTGYQPQGFTVPEGQVWQITGLVETPRNVVVRGTLQMRPGSTLRFVNVDEWAFVGGGMNPLASDVGLWVMGAGVLDVQGTPRGGWNRMGTDPTWQPGDEVVVAPTAINDFATFAPFAPGSPVPNVGGGMPNAEVLNLTRDVRIEGTPGRRTHIFIRSSRPQTIRHAAIRYVGPRRGRQPVLGRYGLHFHHSEDGSRGSVVEGVVVRDCANWSFVPHMSNGITFRDCMAFNVNAAGYVWDFPHESHDIVYDHCGVFGVRDYPGTTAYVLSGFAAAAGTGLVMRDCVAAGNTGQVNGNGFLWPEALNQVPNNVWTFEDCVAHNIRSNGMYVWQNDPHLHDIVRFTSYRCGEAGLDIGAYSNAYRFVDCTDFQSGTWTANVRRAAVIQHSLSGDVFVRGLEHVGSRFDGGGQAQFAVYAFDHAVGRRVRFTDCTFTGYTQRAFAVGPNLAVGSSVPIYELVRPRVGDTGRDLTPSDVFWHSFARVGSSVRVQPTSGPAWQAVKLASGQVQVTQISAFA